MTRLHFSATPREDARCPVCLHPLINDIWRVVHGIAFCPLCSDSTLEAIRQARINARWHYRFHHVGSLWYAVNGIRFYIGRHPLGIIPARLNEYRRFCGDYVE